MTTKLAGGYVVRRQHKEGEGLEEVKWDEFVVGAAERTVQSSDDFGVARRFGSRLGAHSFMLTYEPYAKGDRTWEVVPAKDVVVRPKQFVAPFDLHIRDPIKAIGEVDRLHWMYCDRIEQWLTKTCGILSGVTKPEIQVTMRSPLWAGCYEPGRHRVTYPLSYMMMAPDYETVVAHEVVHAYQKAFTGHKAGHGGDFYAMMRWAALRPVTMHTHMYNVTEAKRLSEAMIPWYLAARERGLLTSLPCHVEVTKVKRRGIS